MREWHEKASCNVREYKFHCQKPGIFYFGCQIGNCVKGGNMKIAIHVKGILYIMSCVYILI